MTLRSKSPTTRAPKIVDDTPKGGWLGPDCSGKTPPQFVTKGSRVVRGQLVWNWVPYVAPEPVAARVRVRSQAPHINEGTR